MPLIYNDVLQVRTPLVCFYVLRTNDGLYLIDTGFVGGQRALRRALQGCGWQDDPIRGIILTHGHLDHVLNAAQLAREKSAWIAAPRLDARHYEGTFPYTGSARVCGWLEAAGRRLFHYERFNVDRWLDDGSELDIWDGLTAVHLPGHTNGHMGFYNSKRRLLFCGDLFKSSTLVPHFPLNILNSNPAQVRPSAEKALRLEISGILPNHGDKAAPEKHVQRLRRLLRAG